MSNLAQNAAQFMGTFNNDDIDAMISWFAPEGRYIDPHGVTHEGVDAVRAALAPGFEGAFGKIFYEIDETLLDEARSLALVTWTLRMQAPDGTSSHLHGLDILQFDGDRLVSKNAFCKAGDLAIQQ